MPFNLKISNVTTDGRELTHLYGKLNKNYISQEKKGWGFRIVLWHHITIWPTWIVQESVYLL